MTAIPSDPMTLVAGSSLASAQWCLGAIAADHQVDLPSGQGVQCHGIVEEIFPGATGTAGEAGSLIKFRTQGASKVKLGETMASGAAFTAFDATGAAGVAIAADHVQGYLIKGGVAGDIVPCVLAYAGIF